MSKRTDIERLRLFSERVALLVGRRGFREATIASRFNFSHKHGQTTFSFDIGDTDDLLAVMTTFRQFTAPKEDTHFPAICNVLENVLHDPELRAANRANREAWKRAEQGGVLLQVPGMTLTHRACFDLWVNAEIFHSDPDKETFLRNADPLVQQHVKTGASGFVIEGARVLHAQRNVVNAHLEALGV
jgi:hypothetical protein